MYTSCDGPGSRGRRRDTSLSLAGLRIGRKRRKRRDARCLVTFTTQALREGVGGAEDMKTRIPQSGYLKYRQLVDYSTLWLLERMGEGNTVLGTGLGLVPCGVEGVYDGGTRPGTRRMRGLGKDLVQRSPEKQSGPAIADWK